MKAPMTKLGPPGADREDVSVDGTSLRLGLGWNRGEHYRLNPALATMLTSTAVENHILHGWLPEEPLIGRSTSVLALGSCFAQKFADHLLERQDRLLNEGDSPHVLRIHAGMATSFSIRQHLEWALEGKAFEQSLWQGFDVEALGFGEEARREARARYLRTDVFLVTLGLAEIWQDKITGETFWRAVPRDRFDPERHLFRVSSVTENLDNLRFIYRTIRHHRPTAKIVLSLSPIPLYATFRPQSCITANAASKAILRAAIDELWREVEAEGFLHYWPSFEIVTEAFGRRFEKDRREIKGGILRYIMLLFEKHYCEGHRAASRLALLQAFIEARAVSGSFKFEVVEALERRDLQWLLGRVRLACGNDNFEFIEPLARCCCQVFPNEAEFPNFLEQIERALSAAGRSPTAAGAEP